MIIDAIGLASAVRLDRGDALKILGEAINSADTPLVVADVRLPDQPLVLANAAFLDLTGYAESEVIGRNCRFLQGPRTHPDSVVSLRDALRTGAAAVATLVNYRRDGSAFLNRVTLAPVHDSDGRPAYYLGSQLRLRLPEEGLEVTAEWTFD
jgi:PAS domain S-box-containing protein